MLFGSGIVVRAGVVAGTLAGSESGGWALGAAATPSFYYSVSRWAWNSTVLYLGAAATPGISRSYEMCRHIVRHSSTNRL